VTSSCAGSFESGSRPSATCRAIVTPVRPGLTVARWPDPRCRVAQGASRTDTWSSVGQEESCRVYVSRVPSTPWGCCRSRRRRRGFARHAEAVRDHLWWRPGWCTGRSCYTWHITFDGDGDGELHALAERYRSALTGLPAVTPVPDRWLHLTMQGIGFADEIADADLRAIIESAGTRLTTVEPVPVQLGPAVVGDEAVALPAEPHNAVRAIRTAIRAAIADVWGPDQVPEDADRFRPHASVAYLAAEGPAAPYIAAVSSVRNGTARTTVRAASLIRLNRDRRMYVWDTLATMPLGGRSR
jgi:hypothetical protein